MDDYLRRQIITYMGNKRKLLPEISNILDNISEELGKNINFCGCVFWFRNCFKIIKNKIKNFIYKRYCWLFENIK